MIVEGDGGRRRRAMFLLALCGIGLLIVAWIAAVPPGTGADEPAHYVRAMAAARGEFRGASVRSPESNDSITVRFFAGVTRAFEFDARFAPDPQWGCSRFTGRPAVCVDQDPANEPPTTGTVVEPSHVGPYSPAPYLPIGLVARVTSDADTALYAARIANGLLSLGLLALALRTASGAWSRRAILVAVTPMVLYFAATLNTSGIEIAAGIAMATSIVVIARTEGDRPWVAFAVSGACLAITRPLGAYLVGALVAVLLVLCPLRQVRTWLRRRAALIALAVVAAASLAGFAWHTAFMPRSWVGVSEARHHIRLSLSFLPELVEQVTSWVDPPLPNAVALIGAGLLVVLCLAGLAFGSGRERLVIAGVAGGSAVLLVLLNAFTQIPFGFVVQARYVLPMAVSSLIVSGAAIDGRRFPAAVLAFAGASVGVVHFVAWYVMARRAAVGDGGAIIFLRSDGWDPALGWVPWMLMALLGAGSVAVAVALSCQPLASSRERVPS